jgi:hypothetical protein
MLSLVLRPCSNAATLTPISAIHLIADELAGNRLLLGRGIVNRKEKRGGGRRRPPNESLIGRTEVARLLQRDRRTVCRYEKQALLKPALIEADGVRWFDREAVKVLAAHCALTRRARGGAGTRQRPGGATPTPAPQADGAYYPELRARRAPVVETPRPLVKTGAPAPLRPGANEVALMQRGLGARTEIRSEWWDGDLTLAQTPAPQAATGTTEADPGQVGNDFKPPKE